LIEPPSIYLIEIKMIALPAGLIPTPSSSGSATGTAKPALMQVLAQAATNPGADPSFFAVLSDLAAASQAAATATPTVTKKGKTPSGAAAGTSPGLPFVPLPAATSTATSAGVNRVSAAGNQAPQGTPVASPATVGEPQSEMAAQPHTGSTPPSTALAAGFPDFNAVSSSKVAAPPDKPALDQPPSSGANQGVTAAPERAVASNPTGDSSAVHPSLPPAQNTLALPVGGSTITFNGLANSAQLATPALTATPTNEPEAAKASSPNASPGMAQPPGTAGPSYAAPGTGVEAAKPTASLTDQVHERTSANLDQLRQSGHVEVQMNLHPPELGHVQLHLALDDGQVSVHFVVQNDGAKAALDHQMEPLRARFAEMGLAMGQFDVRRDGASNQETAAQPEASAQTAQAVTKATAPARKPYVPLANSLTSVDVMA
jgi:flagellar hook-length control protein FliK